MADRRKTPEDEALAQLRSLLFGPEQKRLSALQEELGALKQGTIEIHAQDLSEILPDAVALRPKPDKKLTQALMPTVEASLDTSIKRDPQRIVDAISPVMMPAIRKAIAQTLTRMVQSLNQTLEHGLSPRSLKWRVEALRTGKPFAEIVLLHTLIYSVEQAFLIHRETGLLLQHVVAEGSTEQDADMVSAMLTAIRDFVRDSFNLPSGDSVDALQVGELTVWVEQGQHAILAAVIHGNAPQRLREVLQDVLVAIHLEYRHRLASFDGNTSAFDGSGRFLQPLLVRETLRPKSKTPILLWLLVAILAGSIGFWLFSHFRERREWIEYVWRLEAEEGIVVTHTGRRDGKYFVSGLRDELASNPQTLLSGNHLSAEKVFGQWEPYQALSSKFVLARAQRLLQPPETVTSDVC